MSSGDCFILYYNVNAPKFYEDEKFRIRSRFLFRKWHPATWYFGQCLISRNLLLALAGVLFPNQHAVRLTYMMMILIGYLVLVLWLRPWFQIASNILDGALTVGLIVIITFSLQLMDPSEYKNNVAFSVAIVLVGMLCLVATMTLLCKTEYAIACGQSDKNRENIGQAFRDFCKTVTENANFQDDRLSVYFLEWPEQDVQQLALIITLISTEVAGGSSQCIFSRLMRPHTSIFDDESDSPANLSDAERSDNNSGNLGLDETTQSPDKNDQMKDASAHIHGQWGIGTYSFV